MKPSSALPGCFFCFALLAGGSCEPTSKPAPANIQEPTGIQEPAGNQETTNATTPGAADDTTPPREPDKLRSATEQDLTPECNALLAKARRLREGIPRVFLAMKRKAADINRDMIECISVCESYLNSCAGTTLDCEVKGLLARVLLGRYERHRQELRNEFKDEQLPDEELKIALDAQMTEYRKRIRELAEAAAKCSSSKSPYKAEALRVLVDVSQRERDFEQLRAGADLLLDEFPDYDLRSTVIFSKGRSFIAQGDYQGAVDYMRQVIDERSEDDEYIMYNIVLFEGLSGAGNLEGVEELMETILVQYPVRLPKVKKDYLRGQYEQWLNVAKFWIGFARYGLGDLDGARQAFEEHRAQGESLRAKLAERGQKLDPVVEITLEYRTKDLLLFLEEFQGNVPEVDMEFGSHWATVETMTLAEARGNVVIIVFRRPGDRRSASFLQEAAKLVDESGRDGLNAVTVGYLLGNPDAAADAEKLHRMREDLKQLGIQLPAGYDPDRQRQSFFRAVHGTVGTASCVILDRNGGLAYFMADPRDMDRQVLRRVVGRLLKE